MSTYKSYIGDIGTRIRTYTQSNLTGATSIEYRVKKPNNTEEQWNCGVESYTGGIVYHDVASGEFDVTGQYNYQVFVEFDDGDRFLSHTSNFIVYGEYE